MSKILLATLLYLLCSSPVSARSLSPVRERVNINREWRFHLGDLSDAENTDYDDHTWTAIHLPHSFSIPYFAYTDVFHGYGWYRKTIHVGREWTGKCVGIEFEGSFLETEVFVNGRRVGMHQGGYTTFTFDLTPYLHEGDNVLAVRVNNLWNPRVAPRSGDHQFSGGIYRDVWLNVTDPLHVTENGTYIYTPQVSREEAIVTIEAELRNDNNRPCSAHITTTIYDPNGKRVTQATSKISMQANSIYSLKQTFSPLSRPQLWSPETPYRYKAVTTIKVGGRKVDSYTTRFGIRKLEWTANRGFFLNDEHYYLLGVNVHQDQAGWGDAVTNGAMRRDVQMMKDAGLNCIRASHYPHDPAFAEACDSIGMLLFMETMNWGTGGHGREGAYGVWPCASSYPTIAEDQPYYEQNVLAQLREEIRTHRNSPSIACWSLCNEPFFCTDDVDDKMKALLNMETDSARKWDPWREVAIGGCQRKGIDRLGKGAIAFYNGDGASIAEFQNPGVPNIVSEYGYPEGDRPNHFDPRWGDLRNGYNRPAWRSGQVIWCGFDHGTVAGYGLGKTGLVDYFRIPKRNYYWYVEAYKKGHRDPMEPQWPKEGTPAKLKLSASQTIIPCTDGTDDTQIFVRICDAQGLQLSNTQPVTLTIVSGPGEFPTGRSITFTPPVASHWKEFARNEEGDIRIMDGIAAIALHSYHAGKSVIEATSEGLQSDRLTITTQGTPKWHDGINQPVADRPYKRFHQTEAATQSIIYTLADQRPTWSSNDQSANHAKNFANDGKMNTSWLPADDTTQPWWYVSLEAQYSVSSIELTFPKEDVYQFYVEVGKTTDQWTRIIDQTHNTRKQHTFKFEGEYGSEITYVRITFTGTCAGLTEIRVGGKP